MNPLPLFLIIALLPLLLGGCGEKAKVEPVAEVKTVEEKELKVKEEVKPEEPVAETKQVETVSVSHNLKYEIKDDTVTITGCDAGASGRLVIPATIEGKPVTSIGGSAFSDFSNLTSITIPDSVTSIGREAFSHCSSLTSITIPDSVTSIGDAAFYGASLTNITIGNSVTSIGQSAFEDCTSLTTVTFLGDAPKEGKEVFKDATPTIYRKPEAKGWGDTWGDRPVKLISEKP